MGIRIYTLAILGALAMVGCSESAKSPAAAADEKAQPKVDSEEAKRLDAEASGGQPGNIRLDGGFAKLRRERDPRLSAELLTGKGWRKTRPEVSDRSSVLMSEDEVRGAVDDFFENLVPERKNLVIGCAGHDVENLIGLDIDSEELPSALWSPGRRDLPVETLVLCGENPVPQAEQIHIRAKNLYLIDVDWHFVGKTAESKLDITGRHVVIVGKNTIHAQGADAEKTTLVGPEITLFARRSVEFKEGATLKVVSHGADYKTKEELRQAWEADMDLYHGGGQPGEIVLMGAIAPYATNSELMKLERTAGIGWRGTPGRLMFDDIAANSTLPKNIKDAIDAQSFSRNELAVGCEGRNLAPLVGPGFGGGDFPPERWSEHIKRAEAKTVVICGKNPFFASYTMAVTADVLYLVDVDWELTGSFPFPIFILEAKKLVIVGKNRVQIVMPDAENTLGFATDFKLFVRDAVEFQNGSRLDVKSAGGNYLKPNQ